MQNDSLNKQLVRVKICCIANKDEARLAVQAGASALGFVSRMPSGPGPIAEELIAEIVPTVPPGVATFLLTCETNADAVIGQQRRTRVNTIQLVDAVEPGTHARLRDALPGISIVQVIHVVDRSSVDEALSLASQVDALLLDSGNPRAAVKELGGTGRVHNWALSREIRDNASVPIYLAGGLKPSNAQRSIDAVRPFGLDVCSGVRVGGRLDAKLVEEFLGAARHWTGAGGSSLST